MKYYTHNQMGIDYNFSCLQGHIDISYHQLVDAFGKPTDGDGYKIDAEWVIKFEDGVVATIYNWKNGYNYLGDEGLPVQMIDTWHIGGFSQDAVSHVTEVLFLDITGQKTRLPLP